MKLSGGINKWGSALLGVVCLFLVANLATQYRGMQPGRFQNNSTLTNAASAAARAPAAKGSPKVAEDLAKYDPSVHFDSLKALDTRPLPNEPRNPFEFVGGTLPPPQIVAPVPRPVAPPPPPPPPLKAVGYNEMPGGQKEAMVTFNNDLNIVHEGDTIAGKFKVMSITSTMVVVQDDSTQERINLPIPQ